MTTTPEQPETSPPDQPNPDDPRIRFPGFDPDPIKAALRAAYKENPNNPNIPAELIGQLIGDFMKEFSKEITIIVFDAWDAVLYQEEDEALNPDDLPF